MAGLVPKYESGFDLPPEGNYLFQIESVEFNAEEKGTMGKVKCQIIDGEHSEAIGLNVFDNFPLWAQFGCERLLGLCIKAADLPTNKEYPLDFFSDSKVQAKTESKLKGSQFGGKVEHRKLKKDKETMVANITKYYNRVEMKSMLAGSNKGSTTAGAAAGAPAAASGGEETVQGWD